MWVVIAFLAGCVLAGGLAWLLGRRATVSSGPTPAEAEAKAQTSATEMLHAPDSVVVTRIDQLRKRGRSGK